MFRKLFLSAMLIAASSAATAGPIITYSEGFDDVTTLAAAGWTTGNLNTPGGSPEWFQGNSGIFAAESGAADSYIAANFLGAPFGGNIFDVLFSPVISVYSGSVLSFATRTDESGFPGDNLGVYLSTNGSAFVNIFDIVSGSYPTDWTTYSHQLGAGANIQVAFLYQVTDTSVNGNYIGVDSVKVAAVPEPGTIAMFGAAFAMMFVAMRRRRSQI